MLRCPRPVGNTALSGQYLPAVPYKLLHAYALAELGLIQPAAASCQSRARTLQVGRAALCKVECQLTQLMAGHVPTAISHCLPPLPADHNGMLLRRSAQALGGKVPPGLLVCRAVAADLRDRLQQYATVGAAEWGAKPCCT